LHWWFENEVVVTVQETTLGRFFEDFEIGDVYRHPLGRTITDADNVWFTLLTMNTNPNHFDYQYASQSEFGKPLVNSSLTVAIVLGQTVIDTSQQAFANLGWDEIRLTHPVFVGDTLYAESLVLDKRESKSRPHGGIVTVKSRGLNQDGKQVVSWKRTFFVYKRGAEGARSPFPHPESPIEG
jgi:itaconyl-CoA hydratase